MAIEDEKINSKMIIIDTDTYAGNFERELCAYVSGIVGDCEVGIEIAEKAMKEIKMIDWWNENINPQETEDGSEFFRPCTIMMTPEDGKGKNNLNYNSVAIFVESFPNDEIIEELMTRAKVFCENKQKIYDEANYFKTNESNKITLLNIRMIEPIMEKILVEKEQISELKTIKKFKF